MLLSEFARVTGLTPDTVRFYVRLGLLVPDRTGKGGRNPYSVFNEEHVRAVEDIRLGQALGQSLNQMLALKTEHEAGGLSRERRREIAVTLLAALERKATDLGVMASWLRASIAWEDDGQRGPRPEMPLLRRE